jgi:hypothetical protein
MAALGAAAALSISAASEPASSADRISFIYTLGAGTQDSPPVNLPLTIEKAEPAGWSDSGLCSNRMGRPFGRFAVDEPDPFLLMFSKGGRLIGINLISPVEQPSPWEYLPDGISVSLPGRDAAHWSLSIYVIDPFEKLACLRTTFILNP